MRQYSEVRRLIDSCSGAKTERGVSGIIEAAESATARKGSMERSPAETAGSWRATQVALVIVSQSPPRTVALYLTSFVFVSFILLLIDNRRIDFLSRF